MSVYYKFNSELNYSYVDFDGLHIAVSDLKKAILHQKRLGKSADFDLLVSALLDLSVIKWFFILPSASPFTLDIERSNERRIQR